MKTFSYTIKNPIGIHGRPAGQLVNLAKSFSSSVIIEKDGKEVSASRLIMLMSMGIKGGDTVKFRIEGDDEDAAAKAVEEFMNANL